MARISPGSAQRIGRTVAANCRQVSAIQYSSRCVRSRSSRASRNTYTLWKSRLMVVIANGLHAKMVAGDGASDLEICYLDSAVGRLSVSSHPSGCLLRELYRTCGRRLLTDQLSRPSRVARKILFSASPAWKMYSTFQSRTLWCASRKNPPMSCG